MQSIIVCNQKGGTGKSLCCDLLLSSFSRTPTISAAFVDLDQQGGLLHTPDRRRDAEVVVVDTPGALQPQLAEWLQGADVVVVPTRMSYRDAEPYRRTIDIVQENAPNAAVLTVLNGWTRYSTCRDFEEWFLAHWPEADFVRIPYSEMIMQADMQGVSVVDYAPRSPAARAALEFSNRVRALLGRLPETSKK